MAGKRRGNNEGTVRKRIDGRWEGRVRLPGGASKCVYGKTEREVKLKIKEVQRGLDAGIDPRAASIPVGRYLAEWLDTIRPSVKVKTYEGYESIVRVRVTPRIGRIELGKLGPFDLQRLYADLATGGLSARSVDHTHRCLHRALEQAVRWSLIARNPAQGATRPRPEKAEMQVLSPDEATGFLRDTTARPNHALYVLAITTGMRQGELLGLRWSDVDLHRNRIEVRRALQRQKGRGLVFVEPKTSRSRRRIAIGGLATKALKAQRDRQAFLRERLGDEWIDYDLVFCTDKGTPLDPGWVRESFAADLKRAGLGHVRFHDLRHTAATISLRAGVHPKVVSEMLGHSTISLTLDTYSHLLPVMHEEAAAAMDRALGA